MCKFHLNSKQDIIKKIILFALKEIDSREKTYYSHKDYIINSSVSGKVMAIEY